MKNLVWVLALLSALSFVLAVVGALTGTWVLGVGPEGYSRACSNLALLAIVLFLAVQAQHGKV